MIAFPSIDPEIFRIGPFAIRWYGLMYALGFAASYLLVKFQLDRVNSRVQGKELRKKGQGSRGPASPSSGTGKGQGKSEAALVFPELFLDSLFTWLILGLIIGARVGYVLFYDFGNYLKEPFEIFAVWHGGMSFHGGMIGSLLAGFLCCRKYKVDFWQTADLVIVTAPIGLGLGRIGNFINGELFGRVTDSPWGMVFPAGGLLPRHPSQLYEFALEGVLLFVILWTIKDRKFASGSLCAFFLILYGLFRFLVEFFREPDAQLGFIAGPFTMGQILSALTAGAGIILFVLRKKRSAA
jgi:phosphatidylglycerol:prolipoprotein diacylglycerol transferase